jgi:hypothetical protein
MTIIKKHFEVFLCHQKSREWHYRVKSWIIPGDQEGLFKLVVQLRKFFNSVIYNTANGYVLLVYLTNI